MSTMNQYTLIKEARQQSTALRRIAKWRSAAMLMAAIGVLFLYRGFSGDGINFISSVIGISLVIIGTVLAVIFNIGIHNGRNNVEKILDAAEEIGI